MKIPSREYLYHLGSFYMESKIYTKMGVKHSDGYIVSVNYNLDSLLVKGHALVEETYALEYEKKCVGVKL